MDFYELLGIKRDATKEEIKKPIVRWQKNIIQM